MDVEALPPKRDEVQSRRGRDRCARRRRDPRAPLRMARGEIGSSRARRTASAAGSSTPARRARARASNSASAPFGRWAKRSLRAAASRSRRCERDPAAVSNPCSRRAKATESRRDTKPRRGGSDIGIATGLLDDHEDGSPPPIASPSESAAGRLGFLQPESQGQPAFAQRPFKQRIMASGHDGSGSAAMNEGIAGRPASNQRSSAGRGNSHFPVTFVQGIAPSAASS